ncbi:MAG: glycosyltransferase [Solirubrobacteraceae bacterium]
MRSVSLIVRCFNEEAHIGRLLTGALRQTHVADEIVIVDSGSTDATLAIASKFDVRVISIAPEHFSFGHALNVGMSASSAEVGLFASAHVYPIYDTWIERLVAPFEDDRVALSYGRQQTPPGGRFSERRLLSQWFPAQSARGQRHPFCNNANAAIRRAVWEERSYDEQLTGLEDLDWAKHAMEAGHSIAYVAEAPVIHVHQESFKQVTNRYRREAIAHKDIYNDQEMGMVTAARLAAINIVGDYREALRERCFQEHAVDIPRFRLAQFIGTYRGFSQSGPVTDVLKRRFYYPSANGATADDLQGGAVGRPIDYDAPSASR